MPEQRPSAVDAPRRFSEAISWTDSAGSSQSVLPVVVFSLSSVQHVNIDFMTANSDSQAGRERNQHLNSIRIAGSVQAGTKHVREASHRRLEECAMASCLPVERDCNHDVKLTHVPSRRCRADASARHEW